MSVITLSEIEWGICQQEARDRGFARDLREWLDRTVRVFADRIVPFEAEDARIRGSGAVELEAGSEWGGLYDSNVGHLPQRDSRDW